MVKNMKQLREGKNLKVIDVAYNLGINESTVRNWEHGRSIPKLTFDQVEILMKLYECSIEDLKLAYQETRIAS